MTDTTSVRRMDHCPERVVRPFRIMALSGSLRAASSNTAMLQVATTLAPASLQIVQYRAWGDLPAFNPDLEGAEPDSVLQFRAALLAADAVLIASPE